MQKQNCLFYVFFFLYLGLFCIFFLLLRVRRGLIPAVGSHRMMMITMMWYKVASFQGYRTASPKLPWIFSWRSFYAVTLSLSTFFGRTITWCGTDGAGPMWTWGYSSHLTPIPYHLYHGQGIMWFNDFIVLFSNFVWSVPFKYYMEGFLVWTLCFFFLF